MKVEFTAVSAEDRASFESTLGSSDVLDGRTKITATDEQGNSGYCFMQDDNLEKLGKPYIESHIQLQYSAFFEQWEVKISENDYYNDVEKFPEKEINLTFIGIEEGTGREIYRGIDCKRFFLREAHYPREDFAKWLICGRKRAPDDGNEPRANLIFVFDGQKEKVRYDDWNGVAAYPDTFNKNFSRAIQ